LRCLRSHQPPVFFLGLRWLAGRFLLAGHCARSGNVNGSPFEDPERSALVELTQANAVAARVDAQVRQHLRVAARLNRQSRCPLLEVRRLLPHVS
jgi:hypothetical protein